MFQNSYQNGTYFDLFDPKNNQDKLKLLYKTVNVVGNNKIFDKDLKTYVLEFTTPNSKIHLPKQDKKDLYLIQQYLVFQIYFFPGQSWNIELSISDLSKVNIEASRLKEEQCYLQQLKKPKQSLFLSKRLAIISVKESGTILPSIYTVLSNHSKDKPIDHQIPSVSQGISNLEEYTHQQPNLQNVRVKINHKKYNKLTCNLPKNYYFPNGVHYATKLIKYSIQHYQQTISEVSESTVKHVIVNRPTKPKAGPNAAKSDKSLEVVKTEKHIKQKDIRYPEQKKKTDFLANTNGTEILNRNRKEEQASDNDLSDGNSSHKFVNNSKSTQKTVKKKQLTKTQQIPPKPRSSLQGYNVIPKKGPTKQPPKSKVNPWRNNKIKQKGYTDISQLQGSKHEDERITQTPQTSMVKTKNNVGSRFTDTKNMGFDKRSDQYSDNEYVELSQKFSTLTDGKFFKNQLCSNIGQEISKKNEQDEIEQNIQMETGSVHSEHQKQEVKKTIQNQFINQSINDSLDRFVDHPKCQQQKMEELGRSSLYGFGQQLMRRFMGQIERPYSPPIGEREVTDQQVTQHHNEKQQVQLIYDPVLNCYYDPRTHTYYQLKN